MKILVTGGAGFIGSAFVRLAAANGDQVIVVDKLTYAGDRQRISGLDGNIEFYETDISDYEALGSVFDKTAPDALVNFAAETHVDRSILFPGEFTLANVLGVSNLLELARKHETSKFVQVSTDEVYGEIPRGSDRTFVEPDKFDPNSPYSASKAASDLMAQAYYKTYGSPIVIVRPSNNYGPWQYPEKLLPLSIARLLKGEKIPVYGTGENVRTWLFVDECVEAIYSVLNKGEAGEAYNIGSSEEMRNIDVIKMLINLMDKSEDSIEFVADRPAHDFKYALDSGKIEKSVGWKSGVSFSEGLERTLKWYLEHQDWLFAKQAEAASFVESLRKSYKDSAGA